MSVIKTLMNADQMFNLRIGPIIAIIKTLSMVKKINAFTLSKKV